MFSVLSVVQKYSSPLASVIPHSAFRTPHFLILCLLLLSALSLQLFTPPLAAATAKPSPTLATPGTEVIIMQALEVTAPSRFRWTHAQTPRFEILSNLKETDFIERVVTQAGKIISIFEKSSPLFTPQRDLRVKLIFFQDEMVDRLLAQAGAGSTQDDFDERMAGAPFFTNTEQYNNPYKISALARHNDEQLVIVKFLTKRHLSGSNLGRAKTLRCVADLVVTYLNACVQIHTGGKKTPWLGAALNAMRGHPSGGLDPLHRPLNPEVYGKYEFYRTGWIGMDGNRLTLGRYCLYCETASIEKARDFPKTSQEEKNLWRNFLLSPDIITLGAVFNDAYSPRATDVRSIHRQLAMQRQVRDFMYYCLFIADPGTRAAFTKLVLASAGGQPVDESLFQKLFGAGFAQMQDRMYAHYRRLAKSTTANPWLIANPDHFYKNNPWGSPGLTITLAASTTAGNRVKLQQARRADTTRILSDWTDIINAGDRARKSLLAIYDESPHYMAARGLSEARYGNPSLAITMLEKAAAAKIERPRVYRTLASLYLENALRFNDADYRLPDTELRRILDLLAIAMSQPQPNPQNYTLYAAAFERAPADIDPAATETYKNIITEACEKFPADIDMLESILPSFARRGHQPAALQLAQILSQTPGLPPQKKHRLDTLIETLKTKAPATTGTATDNP